VILHHIEFVGNFQHPFMHDVGFLDTRAKINLLWPMLRDILSNN
jgi:hypothetical protein|tara:strand:- start:18669 stop:18800 length:132 start_codon:yes stop_codon:yes gene_type:complete